MHKAIFLDKDGTLVDCSGYPEIIPTHYLLENDILDGLIHLQNQGYTLIIISNQPWISNGRLTKDQVETIFNRLINKLLLKGVVIHDYFYCSHQSSDKCYCKKPSPFLLFQAARKYKLDLSQSYLVGDMHKDILAGKNAGVKTILVQTGCGKNCSSIEADYVIKNLNAIKEVIL